MRVGSLFSGIGGFDLGLERAGFQTAWFCEQDKFCQQVLRKHWPDVPIYDDICELRGQDVEPVDALCGGFPCQDLSYAGKGAGIEGERSGLWSQYARLIGELRPRYVFVENVPALLTRGLGRVLGDLAALGYDAEWDCIPASAVGAPHRRDRVWIVAYASGSGRRQDSGGAHGDEAQDAGRRAQDDHVAVGAGAKRLQAGGRAPSVPDADSRCSSGGAVDAENGGPLPAQEPQRLICRGSRGDGVPARATRAVPDANGKGLEGHRRPIEGAAERPAAARGLAQREREREREPA